MIPDEAVQAAGQRLKRHMIGDDLECVPRGATLDVADGWVRAIDMAAEEAMPVVLAAALPHLLTDEAELLAEARVLAGELREIAEGRRLPDDDEVDVSVVLWAEGWLLTLAEVGVRPAKGGDDV